MKNDVLLGLECSDEAKEFSERNWLRFDRQYSQLRDTRDQESMIRITLAHAFDAGQKAEAVKVQSASGNSNS